MSGGSRFLTIRFDETGDIDPDRETVVVDAVAAGDVTELVVFSHGWHNTPTCPMIAPPWPYRCRMCYA